MPRDAQDHLPLFDEGETWQVEDGEREAGRQGLAEARAALAAAARRASERDEARRASHRHAA